MALRTYLLLSRPWYLPTVWSNCLAGWWLGGAGNTWSLPLLIGGATSLFLAGSFLKDAFDGHFDFENRAWRPVPARHLSIKAVYAWTLYWAALGLALLFAIGQAAALIGAGLLLCIIAYTASHRILMLSPLLLGLCRTFLYLLSASTAAQGVTGWSIWGGIAVALYTAGAMWIIPQDPAALQRRFWPLIFLFFPVLLAYFMNTAEYREAGLLLSLVLVLWCVRSLRHTWWSLKPDRPSTYSGLVAGTVFVDWLAAADTPKSLSAVFIGLFLLALLLQRAQPGISGKSR
jgi:hypothetical protein